MNQAKHKPKIVIIHPAVGDSLGGSQIFVLELAEKLKDRCDITILSSEKINNLCKPIYCLPRGKLIKTENPFLKLLVKILRNFATTPEIVIEHFTALFPVLFELLKGDYDVVFPNNDWGGLLAASIYRKIKRKPILFTEHLGIMYDGKIAKRNLKFKPDKYIALSEEFIDWVKTNYPDCDVEYIPNGVNTERFNPKIKQAILDLPKPIILTVAGNYECKRLDLIIKAVSKLDKGSLLLVTSGPNTDELENKGKTLIGEDRFKLLKNISYQDIPSYYNACDIFTLPSEQESFGLVYLEAMACNKPVVAPDDARRQKIVDNAGILCDVTNIEEYADTLKKVIETDFGDSPVSQASKFSWEVCAEKYYQVIQSLISSSLKENDKKC
ncbi:MAG: glycosyltransferase [Candidatus Gastranaerophilales bacterium]|nr:glycosyltransferase [Candidatus Gastranaerophilales bacterium]